ncbi:MAG: hypothetical protein R6X20_10905 [Phycisphaerae bacterium]
MSYTTPNRLWEYLLGACLRVNHDYWVRCRGRSEKGRRAILKATKEIDLCAMLAAYFGSTCHLAAQSRSPDEDLVNDAPKFRVEVKYVHPKRTNWGEVEKDWEWLLRTSNNGDEFRKRALVLFWPSVSLCRFTNCLSVPRSEGDKYSEPDYAQFAPYAEVEQPKHGAKQRLKFKIPARQLGTGLQLPGGKRVRVDIAGGITHPIWAAIYTRLTPDEFNDFPACAQIKMQGEDNA